MVKAKRDECNVTIQQCDWIDSVQYQSSIEASDRIIIVWIGEYGISTISFTWH